MTLMKGTWIVAMVALAVGLSACGNKQNAEVQQKLDQMQKELDDAKKQLEAKAAEEKAAAEKAANTAAGAVKSAANTVKTAAKAAVPTQATKNTEGIASNKTAIEKNAAGIATNKDAIATNSSKIEKNRQGVEEAKKMAAAAPYHTLAVGTPIVVRTTNKISTKSSSTGSLFEATLEEPLEVDGYVVASKGATVEGVVTNADPGGRVKGIATITMGVRSVVMDDGRRLPIRTGTVSHDAKKKTGKDAMKVGIASGIGAAIGAIAGGGKGAAIGAGAGAAGGTGMVLGTRGEPAEVGAETVLRFSLAAPAKFQELKR